MSVFQFIDIAFDLFDGIEKVIVLGQQLVYFALSTVDFFRSVEQFPLFEANLIAQDGDLILKSLNMLLLLSVVDIILLP